MRVPVLRQKAQAVIEGSGYDTASHGGKAIVDTLETYRATSCSRPRCPSSARPSSASRTSRNDARCGCSSGPTRRALRLLPRLPAARPLHRHGAPQDGADPARAPRRREHRRQRPRHRRGPGPAARRRPDAGRGTRPTSSRTASTCAPWSGSSPPRRGPGTTSSRTCSAAPARRRASGRCCAPSPRATRRTTHRARAARTWWRWPTSRAAPTWPSPSTSPTRCRAGPSTRPTEVKISGATSRSRCRAAAAPDAARRRRDRRAALELDGGEQRAWIYDFGLAVPGVRPRSPPTGTRRAVNGSWRRSGPPTRARPSRTRSARWSWAPAWAGAR